jgi:hypothetical protein
VAIAAVRAFDTRFDEIRFVFLDDALRRVFEHAAQGGEAG